MTSRWLLWLFAVALMAAFASLGRWQWQRAVHKQQSLDAASSILHERKPQSLATESSQDDTGFSWASGRGHFIPGPALLLDNQRRGDRVGVRIFRPFKPDQGRALLLDLGWLPLPANRSLPTLETMPTGSIQVSGLLAPPPSSGFALGPAYNALNSHHWLMTRLDISALSRGLGQPLAPQVLRLDPTLRMGYARDLDLLPNTLTPERHRGYAAQWFGLAALTFIFTLTLSFRKRPL